MGGEYAENDEGDQLSEEGVRSARIRNGRERIEAAAEAGGRGNALVNSVKALLQPDAILGAA